MQWVTCQKQVARPAFIGASHWKCEVTTPETQNWRKTKHYPKFLRPVAYLAQMATEASLHSLKSVFNQRDPCLNLNFVKVNSRTNFQFSIIQFFRCSYATRWRRPVTAGCKTECPFRYGRRMSPWIGGFKTILLRQVTVQLEIRLSFSWEPHFQLAITIIMETITRNFQNTRILASMHESASIAFYADKTPELRSAWKGANIGPGIWSMAIQRHSVWEVSIKEAVASAATVSATKTVT